MTGIGTAKRACHVRDDRGMEFKEATAGFLRSRRLGNGGANAPNRERTVFEYNYDLQKFFAFLEQSGYRYYNDFGREDVLRFVDHYQGLTLAQSSKSKVFRSLKAFLNWVDQDAECRSQNMLAWLDALPKIPKNEGRLYIPSPDEMTGFFNAFDCGVRWGLRDYVATALMMDCGARIGELCWMKPEDVKADVMMLNIPAQGKTGERLVPLGSEHMVSLLKKWMREREHFAKCDYLFLNRFGGPCVPNTFDQSFADHRQKTGIGNTPDGNLTPHSVRHYFCTHYLVNGGGLHNLKMITGHQSFDTLQIYVHMAKQLGQVREELQKVSPFNSLPRGTSLVRRRKVV